MPPRSKPRRKSARPPTTRFGPPARRAAAPADAKVARGTVAEGAERLQKVLAAAGVAGRRECEQLIVDGRVEVDRQVVTELGTRVDPRSQEIRVDGETLSQPRLVYFAVNKPDGVVSTSRDPAGRPRVIDLLPPDAPRTFCVGRLDRASEGLILVTNDGELANGLTHPRHGVEKIYQVQVAGRIEQAELLSLKRGGHLAEGFAHVKQVRIKSHRHRSTVLEMVLDEGRNREIRRLLAKVGHKVQRLTRIAVGPVRLGELPSGAVRMLTRQEVTALKESVARGPGSERKNLAGKAAKRPANRGPKREVKRPPKPERRIIS
jgi:23S rRNA pseudouridine2605 synthase